MPAEDLPAAGGPGAEGPGAQGPSTAGPARTGVEVAREALAAARAEARRRGAAPGGVAGGSAVRRSRSSGAGRSGPRPDDRDPQPLGRSIERLVADRGWEAPAAVGGLVGRWEHIVGERVAAHCKPDGYEDGVLAVLADSTAWATEIRNLAPALVRRLNEELGDGTVSRVDVRGPSAPSWKRGRLSVRGRGPRDTYG